RAGIWPAFHFRFRGGGDHSPENPRFAYLVNHGPGIDAGDTRDLVGIQPGAEVLFPVLTQFTQNHTDTAGAVTFTLPRNHAVISDQGIGESDQLARVGWVGDHLLIAGHARGKHHLPSNLFRRADPRPGKYVSV